MFQLKDPYKYVRHQGHYKDQKEHHGNTLKRLDDGPIDLQCLPLPREDQNLLILLGCRDIPFQLADPNTSRDADNVRRELDVAVPCPAQLLFYDPTQY